ncbi:putative ATP-dependent RNA helicase TDRD12 [Contarinia nasturtii]|uniref:putative ATP-dependent RNA helicase TDRD12 n=1 Tax=Contarinia nasturtii TaxID=265458 RepID=UPI0012D45CC7|nr:putative ATP-dependent RNA helicase TDRD12 [Contarinia nasturtii]
MCSLSSGELNCAIEITHIINPHLFWFEYKNIKLTNAGEIEDALKKYAKENGDTKSADKSNGRYRCEPVVAVFSCSMKKWIRANVEATDEPLKPNEIILWAMDYGYPIKSTLDLVLILDIKLKKICYTTPSNVVKGGIYQIMPATKTMSKDGKQLRILHSDKWDQIAIEHLVNMKSHTAMSMYFDKKFETNNHALGTLYLKYNQVGRVNQKSVADILLKMELATALSPEKFEKQIVGSGTIKISRWLDNNGDLNCMDNIEKKSDQSRAGSSADLQHVAEVPSPEVKVFDQHKLIRKFSRIQIMETAENQSRSSGRSSKSQTEASRTQSELEESEPVATTSGRAALKERLKKVQETQTTSPKPRENTAQSNALASESARLLQTVEPGLVSKIKSTPIFIRNNDEEPLETVKQANFTDAVHRGLKKMNYQETYVSQGYAWPNLLRGNSLVLVNSQNSGKTMAYLPALCSLVHRKLDEAKKSKTDQKKSGLGMGVTAIIVCLSSGVQKIVEDCRQILQMREFECHVIEGIGKHHATNVTIKLYNGSNILVTTAPCLTELLKKQKHVINNEKLKCIAFENLDCIMEKHPEMCADIIKDLCLRKSYKGDVRQFIVTSRTWNKNLSNFLKEDYIADSVLIIGNYLEASFSAGVTLNFRLCLNHLKLDQLNNHIQSMKVQTERTMIVCNEMADAEQVAEYLDKKQIPNLVIKEFHSKYAISRTKAFWDKIEGVLICTDEHLATTQIRNVQHIIHFSVHREKYQPFLNRFSSLLDFIADEKNAKKATSTLFIDDHNFKQLPKMVSLLTRDRQNVPKELLELSQQARALNRMEKAEKQRYHSICNSLFMHGNIEHQATCQYRHLILPSDILIGDKNDIKNGLRFNVLKVISPTEYIVQPISHADAIDNIGRYGEWQTFNKSNEFDQFNSELQLHYKNMTNQKMLHTFELGKSCVISIREIFYRAEIMQIIEKRNLAGSDKYQVRLIDNGDIELMHASELYTLEKEFKSMPRQAYHLHLTSIIPADKEDDWDPRVCENIRNHINKTIAEGSDLIFEGNVVFTLRNTIVVDIMRLIDLKDIIVKFYVKRYLMNVLKQGESSKASMKKVVEMVKAEGVKIKPKIRGNAVAETNAVVSPNVSAANINNESISSYVEPESPGCSFDDLASETTSQGDCDEKWVSPWKIQHKNVHISQFDFPSCFYVVHSSKELDEMYKAINKHVEENIITSLDDSMEEPDVYKYCLVRIDDDFNRAKVLEVLCGNDGIMIKVFLVDVGLIKVVNMDQVYDIPDNLIQMQPFQAIWCNLVGIKSNEMKDDGTIYWSEERIDEIYNTIDQYGANLILHTVSSNKFAKTYVADTKITCHDVVLLAVNDAEQININEMLVEQKLAEFDPETKHQLENVPDVTGKDNDSDNENWDNDFDPNNSWEMVYNTPPKSTETSCEMDSFDFESLDKYLNEDDSQLDEFLIALNLKEPSTTEVNEAVAGRGDTGYVSEETNDNVSESFNDEKSEDAVKYSIDDNHHQLEYIYKRPRIYWFQSDEYIVLKISAHDGVKYNLEITCDQLIYSTTENEVKTVAIIRFFGCIDQEQTEHNVRGLNVMIRLHKSCPVKWSRLRSTTEKCNWIIQNVEAFKDEDFYSQARNTFAKVERNVESDEEENEEIKAKSNPFEEDDRSFDEAISDDVSTQ